jgi:hypothetical protein
LVFHRVGNDVPLHPSFGQKDISGPFGLAASDLWSHHCDPSFLLEQHEDAGTRDALRGGVRFFGNAFSLEFCP